MYNQNGAFEIKKATNLPVHIKPIKVNLEREEGFFQSFSTEICKNSSFSKAVLKSASQNMCFAVGLRTAISLHVPIHSSLPHFGLKWHNAKEVR